ncbi:MAG: hypothetical protein QW112_02445 [Candidatus Micrarchaeia archaeon]
MVCKKLRKGICKSTKEVCPKGYEFKMGLKTCVPKAKKKKAKTRKKIKKMKSAKKKR